MNKIPQVQPATEPNLLHGLMEVLTVNLKSLSKPNTPKRRTRKGGRLAQNAQN